MLYLTYALNRTLYGLRKTVPHSKKAMPFAADRRHQYWSVDVRYIERQQCRDHQGYIYTVTIWDNYSRQILASGLFRTQDLTAYLTILYQALAHFGIPEAIVSDSGSIFLANLARQIYQKFGIRKVEIDKGQSWENYAETLLYVIWNLNGTENCQITCIMWIWKDQREGQFHIININRRLADHWYHQATSWEEITDIHVDFVRKYNEQEHFAHRKRADGRRTPQDVLGWVKGREIDPAKLDDALTLRRVRQLDQRGYVRFQNWRIYAEAGLARRPADLWIYNETLMFSILVAFDGGWGHPLAPSSTVLGSCAHDPISLDDRYPPSATGSGTLSLVCGSVHLHWQRNASAHRCARRVLVAQGSYRWVRNPRYVAVLSVVIGEAILFRSFLLAAYALVLWGAFHAFVVFVEEPSLRRQFGASYETYLRTVPRWLPRSPQS